MPNPFPFYSARGSHRELGRQHGEQAQAQIRCHLDRLGASLGFDRQKLRQQASRFESLFQTHSPHLLEEVHGLSEGAGIDYLDALAVNIRSALGLVNDHGCTSFVVSGSQTQDKRVLIGQNSDQLPEVQEMAYVLALYPIGKPAILMWTFGGMIGYHGINSLGVSHFANDLGGGPHPRFGLPHYPAKRLMHECRNLIEVRACVARLPFWSNGNYVLCDGERRIADYEITPHGVIELEVIQDHFFAHSNHFLAKEFATDDHHRRSPPDSFHRLLRINTLIEAKLGSLTIEDMQQILRDRSGQPLAICRSPQATEASSEEERCHWVTGGMTIASIVADPEQGRMTIACGNRDDQEYVTYSLEG